MAMQCKDTQSQKQPTKTCLPVCMCVCMSGQNSVQKTEEHSKKCKLVAIIHLKIALLLLLLAGGRAKFVVYVCVCASVCKIVRLKIKVLLFAQIVK